ncbi:MAG TPA: universal stress protein [Solirubrobacterales bacterium]|jgi:APA family basic amino acid/polyamine antiporter|nr:universal stress protein [Solirubrobacterales bacterium]
MARPALGRRFFGVPWLWAVAHSAVAFSVYYSLGVVADDALALTPAVFAVAGLIYVVTTMTYVEGGAMYRERGGSNTLARYAFNELVSFVAGWAILIDYVIVIALAAITVPHYLGPISSEFTDGSGEAIVAVAVVLAVAGINIIGYTGSRRQGLLVAMTAADLLLQVLLVVVGAIVVWDPSALTSSLDAFGTPSLESLATALVISMVAVAGIEASSDLAPDLAWRRADLRHVLRAGTLVVPFIYVGMSFVALMALPVVAGPDGPTTALATTFEDAPVLGVTTAFEPAILADVFKWAVVAIAPLILFFAATVTMLGLSRHVYVLATNRQIPSWLGKLGGRRSTPHVAILIAAAFAVGLVLPGDIELLAAVFAFGATLAISIAHASLIRLRFREPERDRPYTVPLSIRVRGGSVPIPAVIGIALTGAAFVSIFVIQSAALWVGGGWMVFGLVSYFVYRRVVQGLPMTERVTVPEQALLKHRPDVELDSVLVPVLGTSKLDDDIVQTACRLAESNPLEGQSNPRLELLYVIDLPLTVPLEGPIPADRVGAAERALSRAREIADEYPGVEADSGYVLARDVGAAIVERAREHDVEAIIVGGEPPTLVRGGAILGGVRGAKPAEIGPVSEYVLKHAPCRVLLTAPPGE